MMNLHCSESTPRKTCETVCELAVAMAEAVQAQ